MALTMVVVWARFAPCIGRSLTILAVGPSPPPPPPPPAPPPQPTTSNAAASPSTARIPLRRALFTLPPCLDPTGDTPFANSLRSRDRGRITPKHAPQTLY